MKYSTSSSIVVSFCLCLNLLLTVVTGKISFNSNFSVDEAHYSSSDESAQEPEQSVTRNRENVNDYSEKLKQLILGMTESKELLNKISFATQRVTATMKNAPDILLSTYDIQSLTLQTAKNEKLLREIQKAELTRCEVEKNAKFQSEMYRKRLNQVEDQLKIQNANVRKIVEAIERYGSNELLIHIHTFMPLLTYLENNLDIKRKIVESTESATFISAWMDWLCRVPHVMFSVFCFFAFISWITVKKYRTKPVDDASSAV